jgi:hypothetical protein
MRLAVIGGPGEPGREHTVRVLERDCRGNLTQDVLVSGSAPFAEPPREMPAEFVRLAWSADGNWLYAPDGIYRFSPDEDGALRAERTRSLAERFLDFRFGGSANRAAAVRFVEARKRRTRSDGQENFTITVEYLFVHHTRELNLPIKPREEYGVYWIPDNWDGPPAVEVEPDGAMLIFYPMNAISERYRPPQAREAVDRMPAARAEAGSGPFETGGECPAVWWLETGKKGDRVKVETR